MSNPTQIYNPNFYAAQIAGSHTAATIVFSHIFRKHKPASLLDVGCGVGTWCAAALDAGVLNCHGVDGEHVRHQWLRIPEDCFISHDLELPLPGGLAAEIAVCVEVAEHLRPERAAGLVAELCDLAPAVLFSAAVPYQGGTGHVNENWLEYWAALFAGRGYRPFDILRDKIWHDQRIPWWYRQNLVIFADPAKLPAFLEGSNATAAVTRIHPEMFLVAVHRERQSIAASFGEDQWFYQQVSGGRLLPTSYGKEFAVYYGSFQE